MAPRVLPWTTGWLVWREMMIFIESKLSFEMPSGND